MSESNLYIRTDKNLLKALRCDISLESAERIVKRYFGVVDVSFTKVAGSTKADLILRVEGYLERYGHLSFDNRPKFISQRGDDFDIKDLYQKDK